MLVFMLVVLAMAVAGIFPFRQVMAQRRQVANTEAKLEMLVVENAELERRIQELNTPAGIERLAREELGLVREGETGYRVEVSPGSISEEEAQPAVDADQRSFPQRIWDFVTGRDLVPDG